MRLSTLTCALAALWAGAAAAQPIVVQPADPAPARPAEPAMACTPSNGRIADVECVLSLTPPQRGAQPDASRILIRAQWSEPCASHDAQVVELAARPAPAAGLPIVEQASPGRACRP